MTGQASEVAEAGHDGAGQADGWRLPARAAGWVWRCLPPNAKARRKTCPGRVPAGIVTSGRWLVNTCRPADAGVPLATPGDPAGGAAGCAVVIWVRSADGRTRASDREGYIALPGLTVCGGRRTPNVKPGPRMRTCCCASGLRIETRPAD